MGPILKRHMKLITATVALVVIFAAFIWVNPRGFSVYVLTTWGNQGLLLVLAALAQFFVVLVRGIDLSVGSIIALSNVVGSFYLSGSPIDILTGVVIVLATGVACGLLNGLVVVYGRIQPIVVTLATGSIFSGIALLLRPTPGGAVDGGLSDMLTYDFGGIPTSLIIMAIVVAVTLVLLRKSRLGLSMYAIGSAEQMAYMTGLRVNLVKLSAYGASGGFSAMAALYLSAVTMTGDASAGPAYTLASIAAVVLGGVSLGGGVGGPVGAMVGALVLKTISSLMFFAGIPPLDQPFFEGLILAAAIMLGAAGVFRARSKLDLFRQ